MFNRHAENYQTYAAIYDALKGDRSGTITLLERLIKKYQPTANDLLDLACGTGAIAQDMAHSYTVTGVDSAPGMLAVARRKLPYMELVEADMRSFNLHKQVDVAYCLHNSMNHLLTLPDWEQTFGAVAKHLRTGGIFIFDTNSIATMDRYVQDTPRLTEVGQHYVVTRVIKDTTRPEGYQWEAKIFLKRFGSIYTLHRDITPVSAFTDHQIQQALGKMFDISDTFTLDQAMKGEDIGRVYYICKKK